MKKLTITRSEYTTFSTIASCSHCANCGGSTGCGAHCKGGKITKKN